MVSWMKKKQMQTAKIHQLEVRVAALEAMLNAPKEEPVQKMPVIPADVMSEWLNGKERM